MVTYSQGDKFPILTPTPSEDTGHFKTGFPKNSWTRFLLCVNSAHQNENLQIFYCKRGNLETLAARKCEILIPNIITVFYMHASIKYKPKIGA